MADEKKETIADIAAEKRRRADKIEREVEAKMKSGGTVLDLFMRELSSDLRKEADRIEAAHRREVATAEKSSVVGNAAKVREALEALIPVAEHGLSARTYSLNCTVGATNVKAARALVEQAKEAITDARAALAAPPRNCDVGTAEEQEARYKNNCGKGIPNCTECKTFAFKKERHMKCDCKFVWAQMPYEEGGAKRASALERNEKEWGKAMAKSEYNFKPEEAYTIIEKHWRDWAESVHANGFVIGISGGKDSTVVAGLAARIFGKDKVLGMMMPNGVQADIKDAEEVIGHLGIKSVTVNIGKAYEELMDEVVFGALQTQGLALHGDTTTNMPPRLRMTALYAVAQSMGGRWFVLNTSNLSEDIVGYATLWGDNTGSYSPVGGLTVTEILALGDWLGLPKHLVHKTPIDGLQPLSDEDKLGFKYADLDRYIREDIGSPEFKAQIDGVYRRNKFKTDMIHIDGPNFYALGNFVRYNNLPDAEKNADNLDIVRLEPEPRYPEDGKINGEYDDNDNPKMLFMVADEKAQKGWVWKLDVNIKTGEVIGWPKDVKAHVHYKVCDCCRIKYNGKEYYEYVPDFLAIDDEGFGDYIILTIDDGKIVNWSEGKCREFLETEM